MSRRLAVVVGRHAVLRRRAERRRRGLVAALHAWRPGHRGPVLPARRQRRLRRPALRPRPGVRPGHRHAPRYASASRRGRPRISRRFNLDLVGMTVRAIWVDGRSARWSRDGDELTVIPREGLRKHRRFDVTIVYDGVPQTLPDGSGFVHTDDGTLVAGQPDVAATWYPGQRPPARHGRVHVPRHRAGRAPGRRQRRARGRAHDARQAHVDVGRARADGVLPHDGRHRRVRPARLPRATASATGTRSTPTCSTRRRRAPATQFAISQAANLSYKRLARTISVPAGGGRSRSGSSARPRPTGTTCSSRRTRSAATSGRRCPTRTATRARTPASRARSGSACTRSSSTTRPTTATTAARRPARPARGPP